MSNWWDERAPESPATQGERRYAEPAPTPPPPAAPAWRLFSPLLAALSFGYLALRAGHRKLAYSQMAISAAFGIAAFAVWYNDYWVHIAITESYLFVSLASVFLVCGVAAAAAVVQWRDCEHEPVATGLWGPRLTAAAALLAVAAPAAVATYVIVPQINVARNSFVSAPSAQPHVLDSAVDTEVGDTEVADSAVSGAAGTSETAPGSDTSVPVTSAIADTILPVDDTAVDSATANTVGTSSDNRINVLLLGGDAGPGRWNLRTDSMNLVSIDTTTGDAAIIGVPRNFLHAPLPPGALRKIYPNGFDDLLNALFVWGDKHQKVVKKALGDTDVPGATLVTASIAELLGVRIDAWVLVDMAGFIDVIDAVGGLDVFVPKKVPAPGNVPAGKHRLAKFFTKGWHKMDGTDALAFARTRHADSDYYRMARQRCLLASLAAQKGASGVAKHWPALSKVIAKRIRTNLTSSLLKRLLKVASQGIEHSRSVALTPPLVKSGRWNARTVRQIVADTISNSGKYAPKPTTTVAAGSTTTVKIGEAPPSGAAENMDEICRTHK